MTKRCKTKSCYRYRGQQINHFKHVVNIMHYTESNYIDKHTTVLFTLQSPSNTFSKHFNNISSVVTARDRIIYNAKGYQWMHLSHINLRQTYLQSADIQPEKPKWTNKQRANTYLCILELNVQIQWLQLYKHIYI